MIGMAVFVIGVTTAAWAADNDQSVGVLATEAPCPHCKSDKKTEGGPQRQADIDALLPIREYVGRWRGQGVKKRGVAAAAWAENSEWEYDFPDGRASLIFECSDGKYYSEGEIIPSKDGKSYEFVLKPTSPMAPMKFTGTIEGADERSGGQLVLVADKRVEGMPARITIRIVARGDRMIIVYDKPYGSKDYLQLGEVGFTRKGSGFGGTGSPANECVVTGGWGNGTVTYKGKSYYICCTGCRDMFNADPERCIADYAKRKEKQAAEKAARDK